MSDIARTYSLDGWQISGIPPDGLLVGGKLTPYACPECDGTGMVMIGGMTPDVCGDCDGTGRNPALEWQLQSRHRTRGLQLWTVRILPILDDPDVWESRWVAVGTAQ